MIKVIVITPGYISHYRPIAQFLKYCDLNVKEILIATNYELREMVELDGFGFCELQAWKNSNPGTIDWTKQLEEERKILEASYEATRHGMVSALEFQAKHRIHDLFDRINEIQDNIEELLLNYHPKLFISVQLCYNVTAVLEKLNIPYITFVTGNPAQLPRSEQVYGYPYYPPKNIMRVNSTKLRTLYNSCWEVQEQATKQFYSLTGKSISNMFSMASDKMILYNFPRELLRHRSVLPHEYYLGACCRPYEEDNILEHKLQIMKQGEKPIIYISFGTVFSVRGDVLKKIYQALANMECYVVASIGVLESEYRNYLKSDWIVGEFLPQMLILKYADLLVGHGGNNSITEALANGVPVVVFPFASDQFFSARTVEDNKIGTVCDPNFACVQEIKNKISSALTCKNNALHIAKTIAENLEKEKAAQKLREMLE